MGYCKKVKERCTRARKPNQAVSSPSTTSKGRRHRRDSSGASHQLRADGLRGPARTSPAREIMRGGLYQRRAPEVNR